MYNETPDDALEQSYAAAKKRYAEIGVDTDAAIERLGSIPVSVNCWQGDDVTGFEGASGITGGGIMATGNYPGRARTPQELRGDFEFAATLIPGAKRFNLHATYLDAPGTAVDRDQVEPEHFQSWIDWAAERRIALDFNPTFFSHPKADGGFTLSSKDESIRRFWVDHGKRSRRIAAAMGRALGTPATNNFWIPDGMKDMPADRLGYRQALIQSLDEIFAEEISESECIDGVESKLFGIGSESFVVGSHEFYLAYAVSRGKLLTMDAGHYHPTEQIADKISAILPFTDRLMLHVSRPIRWDSDHVVIMDDPTVAIAREIVRAGALDQVFLAVDFFDASINRIAAWVIGLRSTLKSLLFALLEPTAHLVELENDGDFTARLALTEELKNLPFGAVFDKFCLDQGSPAGPAWLNRVRQYERDVLSARGGGA